MNLRELPDHVKDDAISFLCGELLGSGVSRTVYAVGHEGTHVLKVEQDQSHRQNISESIVWKAVKAAPKLSKWFAPVESVSPSGYWLMMARTTPVNIDQLRRRLPRVPTFFADLKAGNWGALNGRIVCHDYGMNLCMERGLFLKTRCADWWE